MSHQVTSACTSPRIRHPEAAVAGPHWAVDEAKRRRFCGFLGNSATIGEVLPEMVLGPLPEKVTKMSLSRCRWQPETLRFGTLRFLESGFSLSLRGVRSYAPVA